VGEGLHLVEERPTVGRETVGTAEGETVFEDLFALTTKDDGKLMWIFWTIPDKGWKSKSSETMRQSKRFTRSRLFLVMRPSVW
jgi:hypothetical protein